MDCGRGFLRECFELAAGQFHFASAGVNEGAEVLKETVLVLRGARVFRKVNRLEKRRIVRSSGEVRVPL